MSAMWSHKGGDEGDGVTSSRRPLSIPSIALFLLLAVTILSPVHTRADITLTLNTRKVLRTLDERFLSFTVDPEELVKRNYGPVSRSMAQALAPAYLRIAGPSSNNLTYHMDRIGIGSHVVSANAWRDLNSFLNHSGINVIICLNVLQRLHNVWDSSNAVEIINTIDKMGLPVDYQLGYENQEYLMELSSDEVAHNVVRLRSLLETFPNSKSAHIVGPDFTQFDPISTEQMEFVKNFIKTTNFMMDALTIHPSFSLEKDVSTAITKVMNIFDDRFFAKIGARPKPIWLAESELEPKPPGIEATMNSVVELGVAAEAGADMFLLRPQPFYPEHTTPDFWMAALHKALVGTIVLSAKSSNTNLFKSFVHCTKPSTETNPNNYEPGSITIYGTNLDAKEDANLSIKGLGLRDEAVHVYILTYDQLTGQSYLNEKELSIASNGELPVITPIEKELLGSVFGKGSSQSIIQIPKKSIFFLVLPENRARSCVLQGLGKDRQSSYAANLQAQNANMRFTNKNFLTKLNDFKNMDKPKTRLPDIPDDVFDWTATTKFGSNFLGNMKTDLTTEGGMKTKYVTFSDNNWLSKFPEKVHKNTLFDDEFPKNSILDFNKNTRYRRHRYPSHTVDSEELEDEPVTYPNTEKDSKQNGDEEKIKEVGSEIIEEKYTTNENGLKSTDTEFKTLMGRDEKDETNKDVIDLESRNIFDPIKVNGDNEGNENQAENDGTINEKDHKNNIMEDLTKDNSGEDVKYAMEMEPDEREDSDLKIKENNDFSEDGLGSNNQENLSQGFESSDTKQNNMKDELFGSDGAVDIMKFQSSKTNVSNEGEFFESLDDNSNGSNETDNREESSFIVENEDKLGILDFQEEKDAKNGFVSDIMKNIETQTEGNTAQANDNIIEIEQKQDNRTNSEEAMSEQLVFEDLKNESTNTTEINKMIPENIQKADETNPDIQDDTGYGNEKYMNKTSDFERTDEGENNDSSLEEDISTIGNVEKEWSHEKELFSDGHVEKQAIHWSEELRSLETELQSVEQNAPPIKDEVNNVVSATETINDPSKKAESNSNIMKIGKKIIKRQANNDSEPTLQGVDGEVKRKIAHEQNIKKITSEEDNEKLIFVPQITMFDTNFHSIGVLDNETKDKNVSIQTRPDSNFHKIGAMNTENKTQNSNVETQEPFENTNYRNMGKDKYNNIIKPITTSVDRTQRRDYVTKEPVIKKGTTSTDSNILKESSTTAPYTEKLEQNKESERNDLSRTEDFTSEEEREVVTRVTENRKRSPHFGNYFEFSEPFSLPTMKGTKSLVNYPSYKNIIHHAMSYSPSKFNDKDIPYVSKPGILSLLPNNRNGAFSGEKKTLNTTNMTTNSSGNKSSDNATEYSQTHSIASANNSNIVAETEVKNNITERKETIKDITDKTVSDSRTNEVAVIGNETIFPHLQSNKNAHLQSNTLGYKSPHVSNNQPTDFNHTNYETVFHSSNTSSGSDEKGNKHEINSLKDSPQVNVEEEANVKNYFKRNHGTLENDYESKVSEIVNEYKEQERLNDQKQNSALRNVLDLSDDNEHENNERNSKITDIIHDNIDSLSQTLHDIDTEKIDEKHISIPVNDGSYKHRVYGLSTADIERTGENTQLEKIEDLDREIRNEKLKEDYQLRENYEYRNGIIKNDQKIHGIDMNDDLHNVNEEHDGRIVNEEKVLNSMSANYENKYALRKDRNNDNQDVFGDEIINDEIDNDSDEDKEARDMTEIRSDKRKVHSMNVKDKHFNNHLTDHSEKHENNEYDDDGDKDIDETNVLEKKKEQEVEDEYYEEEVQNEQISKDQNEKDKEKNNAEDEDSEFFKMLLKIKNINASNAESITSENSTDNELDIDEDIDDTDNEEGSPFFKTLLQFKNFNVSNNFDNETYPEKGNDLESNTIDSKRDNGNNVKVDNGSKAVVESNNIQHSNDPTSETTNNQTQNLAAGNEGNSKVTTIMINDGVLYDSEQGKYDTNGRQFNEKVQQKRIMRNINNENYNMGTSTKSKYYKLNQNKEYIPLYPYVYNSTHDQLLDFHSPKQSHQLVVPKGAASEGEDLTHGTKVTNLDNQQVFKPNPADGPPEYLKSAPTIVQTPTPSVLTTPQIIQNQPIITSLTTEKPTDRVYSAPSSAFAQIKSVQDEINLDKNSEPKPIPDHPTIIENKVSTSVDPVNIKPTINAEMMHAGRPELEVGDIAAMFKHGYHSETPILYNFFANQQPGDSTVTNPVPMIYPSVLPREQTKSDVDISKSYTNAYDYSKQAPIDNNQEIYNSNTKTDNNHNFKNTEMLSEKSRNDKQSLSVSKPKKVIKTPTKVPKEVDVIAEMRQAIFPQGVNKGKEEKPKKAKTLAEKIKEFKLKREQMKKKIKKEIDEGDEAENTEEGDPTEIVEESKKTQRKNSDSTKNVGAKKRHDIGTEEYLKKEEEIINEEKLKHTLQDEIPIELLRLDHDLEQEEIKRNYRGILSSVVTKPETENAIQVADKILGGVQNFIQKLDPLAGKDKESFGNDAKEAKKQTTKSKFNLAKQKLKTKQAQIKKNLIKKSKRMPIPRAIKKTVNTLNKSPKSLFSKPKRNTFGYKNRFEKIQHSLTKREVPYMENDPYMENEFAKNDKNSVTKKNKRNVNIRQDENEYLSNEIYNEIDGLKENHRYSRHIAPELMQFDPYADDSNMRENNLNSLGDFDPANIRTLGSTEEQIQTTHTNEMNNYAPNVNSYISSDNLRKFDEAGKQGGVHNPGNYFRNHDAKNSFRQFNDNNFKKFNGENSQFGLEHYSKENILPDRKNSDFKPKNNFDAAIKQLEDGSETNQDSEDVDADIYEESLYNLVSENNLVHDMNNLVAPTNVRTEFEEQEKDVIKNLLKEDSNLKSIYKELNFATNHVNPVKYLQPKRKKREISHRNELRDEELPDTIQMNNMLLNTVNDYFDNLVKKTNGNIKTINGLFGDMLNGDNYKGKRYLYNWNEGNGLEADKVPEKKYKGYQVEDIALNNFIKGNLRKDEKHTFNVLTNQTGNVVGLVNINNQGKIMKNNDQTKTQDTLEAKEIHLGGIENKDKSQTTFQNVANSMLAHSKLIGDVLNVQNGPEDKHEYFTPISTIQEFIVEKIKPDLNSNDEPIRNRRSLKNFVLNNNEIDDVDIEIYKSKNLKKNNHLKEMASKHRFKIEPIPIESKAILPDRNLTLPEIVQSINASDGINDTLLVANEIEQNEEKDNDTKFGNEKYKVNNQIKHRGSDITKANTEHQTLINSSSTKGTSTIINEFRPMLVKMNYGTPPIHVLVPKKYRIVEYKDTSQPTRNYLENNSMKKIRSYDVFPRKIYKIHPNSFTRFKRTKRNVDDNRIEQSNEKEDRHMKTIEASLLPNQELNPTGSTKPSTENLKINFREFVQSTPHLSYNEEDVLNMMPKNEYEKFMYDEMTKGKDKKLNAAKKKGNPDKKIQNEVDLIEYIELQKSKKNKNLKNKTEIVDQTKTEAASLMNNNAYIKKYQKIINDVLQHDRDVEPSSVGVNNMNNQIELFNEPNIQDVIKHVQTKDEAEGRSVFDDDFQKALISNSSLEFVHPSDASNSNLINTIVINPFNEFLTKVHQNLRDILNATQMNSSQNRTLNSSNETPSEINSDEMSKIDNFHRSEDKKPNNPENEDFEMISTKNKTTNSAEESIVSTESHEETTNKTDTIIHVKPKRKKRKHKTLESKNFKDIETESTDLQKIIMIKAQGMVNVLKNAIDNVFS